MTLPWNAQQVEWLQAMGLEVLQRPAVGVNTTAPDPARGASGNAAGGALSDAHGAGGVPAGLLRAARGLDLAPLLADAGVPRDGASRRAFWRLLRPLRKAARRG